VCPKTRRSSAAAARSEMAGLIIDAEDRKRCGVYKEETPTLQ